MMSVEGGIGQKCNSYIWFSYHQNTFARYTHGTIVIVIYVCDTAVASTDMPHDTDYPYLIRILVFFK